MKFYSVGVLVRFTKICTIEITHYTVLFKISNIRFVHIKFCSGGKPRKERANNLSWCHGYATTYSLHKFSDDEQMIFFKYWMRSVTGTQVGYNSIVVIQRAEHGNFRQNVPRHLQTKLMPHKLVARLEDT